MDEANDNGPVTSAAVAFVFSGFNPIVAASAAATSGFLESSPGRRLTNWVANEIYDDILGFSPRTAYMLAYIDLSMTGNYLFERGIVNLTAERGNVVDFDTNNPKHMDLIRGEKYGYNSFGLGQDPTNPDATANWAVYGKLKVIEGQNGKLALTGARQWKLGAVHTGANSPNFPEALNMKYPSSLPRKVQGFTFGWCHQASNATLLKAGFSNVVTQTSGNFSTYLTTFVYGNYGGGLMIKANSIYQGYNNWEKGEGH